MSPKELNYIEDALGHEQFLSNRQIIIRSTVKLPQPFASWSNLL